MCNRCREEIAGVIASVHGLTMEGAALGGETTREITDATLPITALVHLMGYIEHHSNLETTNVVRSFLFRMLRSRQSFFDVLAETEKLAAQMRQQAEGKTPTMRDVEQMVDRLFSQSDDRKN